MDIRALILRHVFWTKDFFKGKPIGKEYQDIALIIEKNDENRRKKHLNSILSHAVSNSVFYKKYDPTNLDSFPVINKNTLRNHYDEVCVKPDTVPFQKGEVFVQKTSGSTGTPFAVPQDTRKRLRRIAELKYFGQEVGFKSHEKLIHLRTWNRWQAKTQKQIFWENIIPFGIANMGEENLEELCEIINSEKVHTVRGYASSIDQLVKYAQKKRIELPSLRLMIAGSEALENSTRELVEDVGNGKINIISQYANEENGILAQEHPGEAIHTFFLNKASYVFEVLKFESDMPAKEGELGRIVITDMFNYAFPMIRYDTGDVGALGKYKGKKVLNAIYGRRMDLIYNADGNILSPMTLARVFKHYDYIQQWQFLQHTEKSYEVRLVLTGSFSVSDELKKEVQGVCGEGAQIEFTYVQDIPLLDSRKRKPVVNLWKK